MICPICLRIDCSMFQRLHGLKIPAAEKRRLFELYHEEVYATCKRSPDKCREKGNCNRRVADDLALPTWWRKSSRRKAVS